MLTSDAFKKNKMKNLVTIKILKNVMGDGKCLREGKIYEVSQIVANSLINYGDAEICDEKPKAKKAPKKKVAKSKPPVDATT